MFIKKYKSHIIIALLLIVNSIVFFIIEDSKETRIEILEKSHLKNLKTHYNLIMESQRKISNAVYKVTVGDKETVQILNEAYQTKDSKSLELLRKKLKDKLQNRFMAMKESDVIVYHFVFPDSTSFLRMHKPSKYGDSLKNIRKDFDKVNLTKEITRGYSQGRVAHAFRHVFPLFNHDKEHIGAFEVSFSSELLQKELNRVSKIHSRFLVKRSLHDKLAWSKIEEILQYEKAEEHDNYLTTKATRFIALKPINDFNSRVKLLKNDIKHNMEKEKEFTLISEYNDEYVVLSFLPIYQNISNQLAGWLVSYEDDNFIDETVTDTNFLKGILFLGSLLMALFILRMFNEKIRLDEVVRDKTKELEELNKNLEIKVSEKTKDIEKQNKQINSFLKTYDQHVIFSKTDLKGIITHVSDAFCKISGYSQEELVGQNHNIVRHPDMPKKLFEELWIKLRNNETFSGEIKNKKKDGSCYWVYAEIEPEYDEERNVIGYKAIRQDITSKKDIEEIQKEIIFTMGSIGESRSKETGNHVKRVAEYTKLLALHYGLDKNEAEMLKQASPMHDIGKVAIPDSILNKPGKLTDEEFELMKTHVLKGYEMLNVSSRPMLKMAAILAVEHHEKWDGTGYPSSKSGEDIHIYGRITALADVFDALGSDRCYKKAWELEKILQFFKDERGKHFDPKLVDIFFENLEEFLEIRDRYKDVI